MFNVSWSLHVVGSACATIASKSSSFGISSVDMVLHSIFGIEVTQVAIEMSLMYLFAVLPPW